MRYKIKGQTISIYSVIINKLKRRYYDFVSSDEDNLAAFSRVIDKTIKAANFINNFTVQNLNRDGLTIYDFFNKIKNAKRLIPIFKFLFFKTLEILDFGFII